MAILIDGATISGGALITGTATDPYFSYVPLLLNTTSSNGQQNNTFLDSSTNNFNITRTGTPTQGSVTPYWPNGQWSNYFNGSTDYLSSTTASTVLQFGTNPYTVEGWVYQTSRSGTPFICGGAFSGNGFQVAIDSSGFIYASIPGVSNLTAATIAIPLNTWTHFALVRTSTSTNGFTYYINGTAAGTITDANNYSGTATSLNVATTNNSSLYLLTGYLSNLRIVKGVAVYTGIFTPPTSPLAATQTGNGGTIQAITGTATSILTCQSNRFRDNSTNNFAITVNGTPKVQAFQPLFSAAPYTTAEYGGSSYFNGSTDYLTYNQTFALGTNNFTLEFWLNVPVNPVYPTNYWLWGWRNNTDNCPGIYLNSVSGGGNTLWFTGNLGFMSNPNSIPTNSWNHIAIVRTGVGANNLKMYVNGVQVAQSSNASSFTYTGTQPIGANPSGNGGLYPANVNISNFRIVNGTAVYTEAFTPPTAPVTAITNTSLLLNFTNAGIFDAAAQNLVTTVANAQASSTPTPQWPPTSMKFNGSTDYLIAPTIPTLNGAFTIEFWFYRVGSGNNYCFTIGDAFTATGIEVYIGSSGTLLKLWSNNAERITSGTTPTPEAWNYIAATRDSSNIIRLYLNGSQVGSTYTSSSAFGTVLRLGAEYYNSAITGYCNGSIQDFRITNGIARTITTPTAPFSTQ